MDRFLTFDDVKQYLIEGDAASEAEQILLKSLKQDELRNRKLVAEKEIQQLQSEKKAPTKTEFQFNVLKISDLLDSLDEPMIQRIPRPKATETLQPDVKPAASSILFDENVRKDPEAIDKAVAEEIFRLDEMKLAIQRKAQDEKLRLERQKRLAEIESQKSLSKIAQHSAENELDIQKKLLAMAEERVLRSAVQRAEIEQKTRELEAIEARSIPFDQLPSFRDILPTKGRQKASSVASSSSNNTKDDFRQRRVQHILSEVNNPEQLEQRRKKIQQLREENIEASTDILDQLMKQPPHVSSSSSVPSTARLAPIIDSSDIIGSPKGNTTDILKEHRNKLVSKEVSSSSDKVSSSHPQPHEHEVERRMTRDSSLKEEVEDRSSQKIADSKVIPSYFSRPQQNESLWQASQQPIAPIYEMPPNSNHYQQYSAYQQPFPSQYFASPLQQQQQQLLQRQMQQLELENMKLQQIMMGGGNPEMMMNMNMMSQPRDYLLSGFENNVSNTAAMLGAAPLQAPPNPLDPAFLSLQQYGSQPMQQNNSQGLSREERLRREELRRIEFEMEKLKKSTELQEFRQQLELRQRQQREEEEHTRWLEAQKRELQRLKMEQVLQKEKRLLELAQQPMQGGFGGDGFIGNGPMTEESFRIDGIREACGVGGGIANSGAFALGMVAGMAIIVDGFIFSVKENSSGRNVNPYANLLCRIALGIYDKQGRSVVRLAASDWTSFVNPSNSPQLLVDSLVFQALQPSLLRNVSVDWDNSNSKGDNSGSGGVSHALQMDYHRTKGLRAIVELQVKSGIGISGGASNEGDVRPLGWCVVPLTRIIKQDNTPDNGNVSTTTVVMNRDCYKLALRKGLSDPTIALDDCTGSPDSVNSSLLGKGAFANSNNGNLVDPAVSVLVRIVEKKDFGRATMWQLAQQAQLSSMDITALYSSSPRLVGNGVGTNNNSNRSSSSSLNEKGLLSQQPSTPQLDRAFSLQSLNSSQASQSGKLQLSNSISSLLASPTPSRPASVKADMFPSPQQHPQSPLDSSGINSTRQNLAPNRLPVVPEEESPQMTTARPPAALLSSAVTHAAKERERDRFWMLGAPLLPASDRYQRGDGLDVYIDAARFLPDNVTATRVTVRIFSSNKEQIGPIYEAVCDPKSPALFPRFHLKAELRATGGGGSGVINATATMLIRIDTLDSCNLQPVAVGYACCKLFCCTPDRLQQPKAASEPGIYVNKGSFQLRLRAGRISPSMDRFSETMLNELTVIPCASVLVRILPAPKSADGISTLSRDEIPRDKWQSLGLMVPAPRYDVGGYCGMYAEPTAQEWLALEAKAKLLNLSSASTGFGGTTAVSGGGSIGNVSAAINAGSGWEDSRPAEAEVLRAMGVITGHGLPTPPPPSAPQAALASLPSDTTIVRKDAAVTESPADAANPRMRWWKSLFSAPDQTRRTLDYSIVLPYSVDAGVNLELVGINRFPADHIFPQLNQPPKGIISGLFSPAVTPGGNTSVYLPHLLTSLSPPSLLYAEPPLFDGVQASRQWDLQRPMNVPRCLDGYLPFSPAEMSARMFVVVDVRLVEVTLPPSVPAKTKSNNNPQAEVFKPAGRLRQYWTMFPLACERSPGLGHSYVASRYMASPLFEGPVPTDGLLTSANPYKELIHRLKQGVQDQKTEKLAGKNGAGKNTNNNNRDSGSGRGIRLSDGASLMVRVLNPLLRDLIGSSLGISRSSGDSRSEPTPGAAAAGAQAVTEVPPDMTYVRSVLSEAGATAETIDSFATYIADRDVQLAMDQWKNNARDTSINAREAASRVPLAQLVPKLPGAAGGSTNVTLIAQAVIGSAYEYFVQDIGLVKK